MSVRDDMLLDEQFIQLYPQLAVAMGINAAAIVQKVFWRHKIASSSAYSVRWEGRVWLPGTADEWVENDFPWLSNSQFRALRDEIIDARIFLATNAISATHFRGTPNARSKHNQRWLTFDRDQFRLAVNAWHDANRPKGELCKISKQLWLLAENQQTKESTAEKQQSNITAAENQQSSYSTAENAQLTAEKQQDPAVSTAENRQPNVGGFGGDLSTINQLKPKTNNDLNEIKEEQNANANSKPSAPLLVQFSNNRVTGISDDLAKAWKIAYPNVNLDEACARTAAYCLRKGIQQGTDIGDMLESHLRKSQQEFQARQTTATASATIRSVDDQESKTPDASTPKNVVPAPTFDGIEREQANTAYRLRRYGIDAHTPSSVRSNEAWAYSDLMTFELFCADYWNNLKATVRPETEISEAEFSEYLQQVQTGVVTDENRVKLDRHMRKAGTMIRILWEEGNRTDPVILNELKRYFRQLMKS